MTTIEILILIYCSVGCGVATGWINSCEVEASNMFFATLLFFSIIVGLFWIITIPIKVTQKLFE